MNKLHYIEALFHTMGQLKKVLESQAPESREERNATMMQYSALTYLGSHKKTSVSDVASHLKLSKSSATQLIERLVKVKLVERLPSETDKRIVNIAITSAGEQKLKELKKKFIDKLSSVFSKIPEEDLKELVRIHTNLITSLHKEERS